MKKLLALVLALVMTLSLCTISNAAFTDAKDVDASYEEAVAVLNGMGVFKGYEDGSFKPEGSITRAEVAAIVYRLYTGDVKDKQAGLYAGYGKFDDMAGAAWAAGYVGFCANAGFVKGYGNGKFGPSDPVTGYQALAMILRAVGYGKNGEFEGADWELHVAQIAQQLKVLKNVKGVSLKAAASRELVAELLFQVAAYVDTVEYTPAFGYVANTVVTAKAETLGEKNFNLAKSTNGADAWGRPQYKWFSDDNGNKTVDTKETKYATIQAKPVMTFTEATTECDICEELGESKKAEIELVWTNGDKANHDDLSATATKKTVGDQGQLVEIYDGMGADEDEYRLVVIDTYLAKVDTVKAEKTDAKGHVTSDAYMALTVYTTSAGKTMYVKGDDYAKDDYVLVNVNEESANDVSIVGFTNKQALVEIVGKADSIEGAQTKIWRNADKHTVADKDYMDAVQFNHNEAGDSTVKFTWLFDQFGNLIGSVALDRSNYAVLKDIIWNTGRPGYAEATLISMVDGKEYTATVDTFDGFYPSSYDENQGYVEGSWMYDEDYDNLAPVHADVQLIDWFSLVGDDSVDNDNYRGLAMYRVDTNDDGTVKLQGFEEKANSDEYKDIVSYAENATVDVKTSAILAANRTELGSLTKTTNFLIRTGEGTKAKPFVYELKTGTKDLPAMQEETVNLFYVDSDKDGFVDYVYIADFVSDTLAPSYVFAYDESAKRDPDTQIWTMNVYVNGEKKDIELANADYELLSENVGKLFIATFDTVDGYVNELMLVNEAHDGTDAYPVTDTAVDYVTGKLESSDGRLKNTEAGAVKTYNTEDATLISTVSDYATMEDVEKASADELAKVGVWVVTNTDGAYTEATYVYVGEKLSSSTALSISTKAGTVETDAKNATKHTVTFAVDAEFPASVTYTVDGKMSLVKGTDSDYVYHTTTNKYLANNIGNTYTVLVESEDGTASAEHSVKLASDKALEISDVVVKMDPTHGATITFKAEATGFEIDTDDMTAQVYNSSKNAVATTGDISIAQDGETFTITVPCTLTQGAQYYAVVTIGDYEFTTATVEAQTVNG